MATQYIIGQERQNQIPNYKHFNWGIKHLYAIPLYPGFFSPHLTDLCDSTFGLICSKISRMLCNR